MDVGDFLELERTFHRHRILGAATEEQRVVLLDEMLGDLLHRRVHRQRLAQPRGQAPQLFDQRGLDTRRQAVVHLAQGKGQQHQPDQLGSEGLGRGHADLRTSLGQQRQVGFAHKRADADIADRQARQVAGNLGVAQGGQGVCGFAGLRDGDEQGVRLHDDLAVAVFARDLDRARDAGDTLQPVAGHHAGVVAGAAGDDLHVAHLGEQLGGLRAERLHQYLPIAQATFEGALHDLRLLMDLLEHEVTVLTLVGRLGALVVLHHLALHRLAVDIPDLHAVAVDLGDVALFQVHETIGDLA